MAGLPVYCSHCGAIFQSRAIALSPGISGVSFLGNVETCVNCGQMARIIDGTFDVSREDVLSMISGPSISTAILQSFARLVDRVANEEIGVDELQHEAEKLNPELGQIVAKVRAKHFGIAGLILLVMFLRSCNFTFVAKLDFNELFDQWTGHGSKVMHAPSSDRHVKNPEDDEGSSSAKPSGNGTQQKNSKPPASVN